MCPEVIIALPTVSHTDFFFPSKFPLKESKVGVHSDYYNCHHGSTAKELGWEVLNRFFSFFSGGRQREKEAKKRHR